MAHSIVNYEAVNVKDTKRKQDYRITEVYKNEYRVERINYGLTYNKTITDSLVKSLDTAVAIMWADAKSLLGSEVVVNKKEKQ